jgi:hypothetical protein
MGMARRRGVLLVMSTLLILVAPPAAHPLYAKDKVLIVYGGRMTDGNYGKALSKDVEFVDAYLVVVALGWTLARYLDGDLTLEVEGQVGKYFGEQDNFEFNLPVVGRWQKFPWSSTVATSFAFGLGLSYATEEPEVEKMTHDGETSQLMAYWFPELTLGPPSASWAVTLRLHHRSTAFGLLAETGGSNTYVAGLKFPL